MMTDSLHTVLVPEMTENRDAPHEERQDGWNAAFPHDHSPIIGIPIPVTQGRQGPLFVSDALGAWAIERAGGRIFLIPLWPFPTHTHIYQSLWPLVQSMDGLLLPAGVQQTEGDAWWKEGEQEPGRQGWAISWEMALAQLATYLGMPVLAIADGAETWNSALGGTRGNAPSNRAQPTPNTPETWECHTIRVRAQSALAGYLQPAIAKPDGEQWPWELAFMPFQGVKRVAPGLRSCAQSEEGTVIAFERRDGAFGLGILGRPDWGLHQVYATTLFDAFLRASQSFDRVRQQQQGWEAARDTICATVSELVAQGQSLIAVPHHSTQGDEHMRSRPHSTPLPALQSSPGQEHIRQRWQQPTKEQLNRIRRQRMKLASR